MPWRVGGRLGCARVGRGSGRPGWRRRRPRAGRGEGRAGGVGPGGRRRQPCRCTACGSWCWMGLPSGPPMMTRPVRACGRSVFGDAERPALADDADSGRLPAFRDVRGGSQAAGRRRPGRAVFFLVLDDLQWADEASAGLLVDVVRHLRGTFILVLATYRESAASGETSATLIPRLSADADTERVDLRGLPAGAVGDMLLAAGLPASAEAAGEVHSETGGNPFLVRELARMLAEQRRGGRGVGRRRCRDGWQRRRPTGWRSCRSRPGAGTDRRSGRQQLLGRRGGRDPGRTCA